VTPADAVIKAMENLQSVLKLHSNKGIAAEIEVLKQMDEYLNGKTCNTTLKPKQVYYLRTNTDPSLLCNNPLLETHSRR
jgi:hypothetical protein